MYILILDVDECSGTNNCDSNGAVNNGGLNNGDGNNGASNCPPGFSDIDPTNPKDRLSGNCLKILPPDTYNNSKQNCLALGGNLAIPVRVVKIHKY